MSLDRIQALLNAEIGLDPTTIGPGALQRVVRERMLALRTADVGAYWERLQGSQEELQNLIEGISVPETWFFRDRGAFVALARIAIDTAVRMRASDVLRVLSAPCATGEEPYSISMCLLDAGLPASRFRVEGLDVSRDALSRASVAVYGRNSFRGEGLDFRDRHFDRAASKWRVKPAVCAPVHLQAANLFDGARLFAPSSFDVIFCRNLLIYLDRASQARALRLLSSLLTPEGTLFVGPSESGLVPEHGFVSARMPMAFAFRRRSAVEEEAPAQSLRRRLPVTRLLKGRESVRPVAAPKGPREPEVVVTSLERAQRLADEGKLDEAMRCCQICLREDATSVQGAYLLGLLHDAAGESIKAREQYRRAVYLDPTHHEALVHLAVILAREGDERGAQQMFARARRVTRERSSRA